MLWLVSVQHFFLCRVSLGDNPSEEPVGMTASRQIQILLLVNKLCFIQGLFA